jgi:hypothetical protein
MSPSQTNNIHRELKIESEQRSLQFWAENFHTRRAMMAGFVSKIFVKELKELGAVSEVLCTAIGTSLDFRLESGNLRCFCKESCTTRAPTTSSESTTHLRRLTRSCYSNKLNSYKKISL